MFFEVKKPSDKQREETDFKSASFFYFAEKRAGSDHSRPAPSYSSRLLFVPYAADLKAFFPQESSNADNAVAASKDITFLLIC